MNELVRDWMTATVITVAPTTTIDEADDLMQSRGIRRLAVIEDNLLAGIVSQGDIRAAKATASADLGDFRHTPDCRRDNDAQSNYNPRERERRTGCKNDAAAKVKWASGGQSSGRNARNSLGV